MSLAGRLHDALSENVVRRLAQWRRRLRRARIERLTPLSEKRFAEILVADLGLRAGDTVYIGSSMDGLHLDFPFYQILGLLKTAVGRKGNILFPTYPNRGQVSSHQWLLDGNVFDVRRTPSYTGILSELARRHKAAVRSLHPTKSVVAIGPDAEDLTRTHQDSPYPYDTCSPYYKLVEYEAKVIGLGVWTEYMSFVYTIDDALKDDPPVRTYHPQIFEAKCIDHGGDMVTVETYATT
jgi:aminoglycoside 3-N-acetyltransferase